MTRDDRPDALRDLRVPTAPSELRHRVIGAARAAFERPAPPPWWDRIWESRTARLAWSAAVLLLIAGHLAFGSRVPNRAQPRVADRSETEAVREEIALPRIEISREAAARVLGVAPRSDETHEDERPAEPADRIEVPS